MVHRWCGVKFEEEEHRAPGDNVGAVQGQQEAGRRQEELPESGQTMLDGCWPGVLDSNHWSCVEGSGGSHDLVGRVQAGQMSGSSRLLAH